MLLRDYARIERAIEFLDQNHRRQPRLGEVAKAAGLSEYHFQRLFRRWAGVSPKRFLQFMTVEHAKEALLGGQSVLHAALDAGLSGPSRLHDHFVSLEAVTPGEFTSGGRDLAIAYGVHASPFGRCFLAATGRGICALEFLDDGEDAAQAVRGLSAVWPEASLRRDPSTTGGLRDRVFRRPAGSELPLTLSVRGTNFQIQIWRALLTIPPGALASYQEIARRAGHPGAERAAGQAIGRNPVAFLIPCHRAIRKTGAFGGYRWGPARKRAILGWEAARYRLPVAS